MGSTRALLRESGEPITPEDDAPTKKPVQSTKKGRPKTKVIEDFSVNVEYSDGRSIDAGAIDRYAGTELSPFMRRMVSTAKHKAYLMSKFLRFILRIKHKWRYAK